MELISIVVITYNAEHTIDKALDSVAAQTYQRLELIVTDDCSTDDTLDVVSRWMSKHTQRFERALLVKAPYNTGVTANVNRGIKSIKGEYFSTLAGDDEWYPKKIEEEYDFLKANGYEMVFSKVNVSGTNVASVQNLNNYCEEGYRSIEGGYEKQRELILQRNIVAGPSWGVRTKASYERMKGFNEDYPFLDDYPYLYKYIMQGNEIHLLGKVLAKYNLKEKNLSTSNNMKFKESNERFLWQERIYDLLKCERYDLLETLIPWSKSLIDDALTQVMISIWIFMKGQGFFFDKYFMDKNVYKIMLVGNIKMQASAYKEFCKVEAATSKISMEDFIQGRGDTSSGKVAYLICDAFPDVISRIMCYKKNPVYYLQDILKVESKKLKNVQL